MKKRGIIIIGLGIVLIAISFGILVMVFPDSDPTLGSELFVPNLLEGMFDQVSDESVIYPGDSVVFPYGGNNVDVPLMWGLQIMDFQDGDQTRISISNIFGDDFGVVLNDDPVIFDMFVIEQQEVYNFKVENIGDREINVIMMFVEDPENSDALNNPDSPLVSMILPLAISGIILIGGIIVTICGVIILFLDWKKEKNQSRNY